MVQADLVVKYVIPHMLGTVGIDPRCRVPFSEHLLHLHDGKTGRTKTLEDLLISQFRMPVSVNWPQPDLTMNTAPSPPFVLNAEFLGPVFSLNAELTKRAQNLIFARNGIGKSFLSRAFRYLYMHGQDLGAC